MKLLRNIGLLCLLLAPFKGLAHGYWFDIQGSGKRHEPVRVRICYGEIDEYGVRKRETDPLYLRGFRVTIVDGSGQRKELPLKPGQACLEGWFTPEKNGFYRILGINEELPVVDRSATGGMNVRPVEYLCTGYRVGKGMGVSGAQQRLDLELVSRDRLWVTRPYLDSRPVEPGTRLRIFNPDNWEKSLETDKNGEAVFFPPRKGMYIVRLDWNDPAPGNYQGVSYKQVRHRCNYCLFVR
ncbi:MAG: hypothetical protein J7576_04250 [Siphonobacter aquaeclarae]|nr:hypothetical protein [Siphonobacter aquaeclarae]